MGEEEEEVGEAEAGGPWGSVWKALQPGAGVGGGQHAGKKGEWGCVGGPLPSHTGHLRSASRGLDLLPNYF